MLIDDQAIQLARNEVPVNRRIPQQHHVSQYVVKTRDGEYQVLFKLDGITFDTMDESRLDSYHNLLTNWLRNSLKGGEFALTSYRVRRRISSHLAGNYSNEFAERMAAQYYDTFQGYRMLQCELYTCVSYRPKLDKMTQTVMKTMSKANLKALEDEHVAKLEDAARQSAKSLADFGIERLGLYEKDGKTYSGFVNFISFLVNGEWTELPVRNKPIYEYVAYAVNSFRDEFRGIKTPSRTQFTAYFDFVDYPENFKTGALKELLYSDYEFVECMGFRPTNTLTGAKRLDQMEGYVVSAGGATDREMQDFYSAREAQKAGDLVFGDFHYSLAVFGDSFEKLKGVKSAVFGTMANSPGFSVAVIDQVSTCGFYSSIPGNWSYAPREAFISDMAYFGMACMHNFAGGKRTGNPWGEAVTILKTPALQPYYFNFHVTDLDTDDEDKKAPGNTIIVGQTGSGKTVLETFLCAHLTKVPKLRLVFFDKDNGVEIFVRRMGGKYLPLELGRPTGFNPFMGLPGNPADIAFIKELVIEIISEYGPVTAQEKSEIDHAIRAVYAMSFETRGFTALLQNMPDTGENSLAQKLQAWAVGDGTREAGANAWIFDNERDVLDLHNGSIWGFDYTELLEYPKLNAPVMMYLLHRVESMLNGDPLVYVMTEFWKALENPHFEKFAKNKQKTIRKQNGFGIFDTQEPEDMIASPIGGTMIQQSVTKIYLPNPSAVWEDYLRMGLSRKEFEYVKHDLHPSSRKFLIKQGYLSLIAMLDLGDMLEVVDVLSASTDTVELLHNVMHAVGTDPLKWAGPFQDALARQRGKTGALSMSFLDMEGEEIDHGAFAGEY